MSLKVYNTLTRKKEEFKPADPDHVKMYVCGPTVYNFAHVGNARPVVVFDLLARLLRHDFPKVTYARNITDIDDKIITAAQETGVPINEITEKYTAHYEEDMGQLNGLLPDIRPKATEYIPQMIAMVETLIAKDHAYENDGHVLFNVPSMDNYGELSNRNRDEMIAGARVEVAPYKKDPADFVLWKPSSDDQPGWDSPWGRGRPGWHLECSCMIKDSLGNTIDIHGGGQDLIFPHHENEIAQSRCCNDGIPLANYWMHNGYLTVEGEKMSKSLGNFITVHELLEEGVRGEAIRMALLSAHYRQPLDFSREGIEQAKKQLDRWYRLTDGVEATAEDISEEFLACLRDDLNSPKAIAVLNSLAKEGRAKELKASAQLFGVLEQADWLTGSDDNDGLSADQIETLIAERNQAKKNRDFATADGIRDKLQSEGVLLKDGPEGTIWERT